MPAYRVYFTCLGEGSVIISAESEEEAKEEFEAQVRDCELWYCHNIDDCLQIGNYEFDDIEKVSEDDYYYE